MNIARLQPEPVHGRQPANRVAALAMAHQFRFGRRSRREIQQQGIIGVCRRFRREDLREFAGFLVAQPAFLLRGRVDHDPNELLFAETGEFCDLILRGHHSSGSATVKPVVQFVWRQQRGGGDHHDAELHCREHRLPQRDHVAEQQQ